MLRRTLLLAVAVACSTVVRDANAALVCYEEACLPLVSKIEETPAGLRAHLGGKWPVRDGGRVTATFDGRVWRGDRLSARVEERRSTRCPEVLTAKNYAEMTEGWEQSPPVCADGGDFVYGGLSFYDGEGTSGRGGLLRYAKRTGKVELRRPPILRDVSVNSLAAGGDVVWFGTTRYQECTGQPVAHGLLAYDWATGKITTYEGSDDGPLGFVPQDLLLRGSALWVASDLGISQLNTKTSAWRHWFFEERDGGIVGEELPVERIFRRLMRTLAPNCRMNDDSLDQLRDGLAKFRPQLLQRLGSELPARQ